MAKVIVCVKPEFDSVKLIISRSKNTVIQDSKSIVNPYDLPAVTAAAKNFDDTIVVAVGNKNDQDTLRKCLGMGIKRACLLEHEENTDHLITSKILYSFIKKENPDVVICGARSIDGLIGQVPIRLSLLLNWELVIDNLRANMAVIKITESFIKPSLPSAISIMQAFKKPIEIIRAAGMVKDLTSTLEFRTSYLA